MPPARLVLSRNQILSFRRQVGALDERLPKGGRSLRRIAWAGLQDSMPRAALLSIHSRMNGTTPTVLDDPLLVQLWGPRFSVFVVAAQDRAVFSLGRLPDSGPRLALGNDLADRIEAYLGDREMPFAEVARAMGEPHNRLRYAAPTGRVLLRWDGARQPLIRAVSGPGMDAATARLELARRYLHVYGPATPATFAQWAGIKPPRAGRIFAGLENELTRVGTPIGEGWVLAGDEPTFLNKPAKSAPARLLPSGDAYYLLQGDDRRLLVPDLRRRNELWTSRVWPGAVMVDGEIIGTWRRSQHKVDVTVWGRLSKAARAAIEAEAHSMPLPGIERDMIVKWES